MNKKEKKQDLQTLRHSASHVLAQAVLQMFPEAKLAIGPAIEDGFYYDFDLPRTLIPEDLEILEDKMKKIIQSNLKITPENLSKEKALEFYKKTKQPYKQELIKDISDKKVCFYKQDDFVDLCAGPHMESTGEIKAFKLLKIAGAYWRGDEKNPMLQRIYGTAFYSQKELEKYLENIEEAKKRDHRKIGKELELFMFSEEVGPGLPIWLPKGMIIREEVEKLGKETELKEGYERVWTPHIAKGKLYETSGHLPYYKDDMYPAMKTEDGDYYLKPMNCPHHYMVYKNRLRSYKEMPLRIAEFSTVYRYEKSGELLGILRPRAFTQNDAHIICRKDQIREEFLKVIKMHAYYYKIFGIKDFVMELALRDSKNKKKYIQNDEAWDYSEKILKKVMEESGYKYVIGIGEAAFYGPKIDFKIKSAIGKEYAISTAQLDFSAGPRFKMTYINEKGKEENVYVIHRSPLGSDERFIGFLVEHYAGVFPLWLSPIQVVVIPISDKKHSSYANKIVKELKEKNIRVEVDLRTESVGKKIREAEIQKIPYMFIVGDKEIQANKISVRNYKKGDLGQKSLKFIDEIKKEIDKKE